MNSVHILIATILGLISSHSVWSAILLNDDFNGAITWPLAPQKSNYQEVRSGKFGTIDMVDTKEPSGGLQLVVDRSPREGFIGQIQSGPLKLQNSETDLAKITLAFDLAATRALPVRIMVASHNEQQERTGVIETFIHPAAAACDQRFALELSNFNPSGGGKFDPTAPYLSFTYEIASGKGWPSATRNEIRLDNFNLSTPAYYVSPQGSDSADGRSAATAFASPQRAVDAAQAGDIILLMDGTYSRPEVRAERQPVIRFLRPGSPAGWITLKNHPGHQPTIAAIGQHGIALTQADLPPDAPPEAKPPALAYIEIRGLHIRGDGDTAREKYPDEIGKWTPNTSSRGIHISPDKTPTPIVHHIRIADNTVEFCVGDGINLNRCDRVAVERNQIYNNCWITNGYVPSGLVIMHYANFDLADNVHKFLVRDNRIAGNRLTVFNSENGTAFWNGNGILIDDNAPGGPGGTYLGRTLVQNNLVFNNGGGGIQMWGCHRLDIANNTLYHNGTTPELKWGNFGVEVCRDVRVVNNIVVSQPDRPLDTWMPNRLDTKTADILRLNNLYFGGLFPNIDGVNDLVADPQFVSPGTDPSLVDFRLQANSPAIKAGRWELFTPGTDLVGNIRPARGSIALGAFQP